MQLVIGYGNPLRGDDGLGCYVAAQLEAISPCEGVEILTCYQLMPELIERLRHVERVLFVDAREGLQPGQIMIQHIEPGEVFGAFTHNVTPESLLAAVYAWYGAQPECYMLSVTGAHFGLSERLSPVVQAALPALLEQIHHLLKQPLPEKRERYDT